jgi:hypothetical protein
MARLFGLLLLLLLPLLMVPASGDYVTEYKFVRDECIQRSFPSTAPVPAFGSLTFASQDASCLPSNGVSAGSRWSSVSTVSTIQPLFGAQGSYSIAMWLQPKANLSTTAAVVAIGEDTFSTSNIKCSNNLVISQRPTVLSQDTITTRFVINLCNAARSSTRNRLVSPEFKVEMVNGVAKLVHVVISVTNFRYALNARTTIDVVGANFTINGKGNSDSYTEVYSDFGTFDIISWAGAGKLWVYPSLTEVSLSANSKDAGPLYYFALLNKVSEIMIMIPIGE